MFHTLLHIATHKSVLNLQAFLLLWNTLNPLKFAGIYVRVLGPAT